MPAVDSARRLVTIAMSGGFQGDAKIPPNVREKLEDYAISYIPGKSPKQRTCKRWTIKPLED
jgi:hypothetical protein